MKGTFFGTIPMSDGRALHLYVEQAPVIPPDGPTPDPIFVPQGWGAQSKGGADGEVYRVDNLNDSGSGSLRDGVMDRTFTPRTVVFDVEGTIVQKKRMHASKPFLTIDGRTAPGMGITCNDNGGRGSNWIISSHHIILMNFRWRGYQAFLSIRPWNDCHDVVLDHMSVKSLNPERGTSIDIHHNGEGNPPDIRNISIQNTIISDNPNRGFITGGDHIHHVSFHHIYMPKNGHRLPMIKSKYTEVINCVVHGWGPRVGGTDGWTECDWINNYWVPTENSHRHRVLIHGWDGMQPISSNYIAGNIYNKPGWPKHNLDPNRDNWFFYETEDGSPIDETSRRFTPLAPAPIPVPIEVANEAMALRVVNNAGAFPHDDTDQRLIDDFINRTDVS